MHESVDAVRAEHRLNESPPKRKGKCGQASKLKSFPRCLNESPSPKGREMWVVSVVSMEVCRSLNESPSKKEGKSALAREGMLGESDPQ